MRVLFQAESPTDVFAVVTDEGTLPETQQEVNQYGAKLFSIWGGLR
jgi:hypothetical protein